MEKGTEPVLIGWTEYIDLPDWNVRKLRAKIDTGARSSALHVEDIVELPRGRIQFDVVLHREKRDRHVHVRATVHRRSRVRSSNGHVETRYFVRTKMRLGSVEREIEISLVDRGKMVHRMLLGRTALSGPFVIDVGRRMVQSAKRKKKVKRKIGKKKVAKKTTARKKKPTVKSALSRLHD
jgi:hypothetical protein